jgi:hypothetical protein
MTPMKIFFTWCRLLIPRLEKVHLSVTSATVQGSNGVRLKERQALTPTDFHSNKHLKLLTEVKTYYSFNYIYYCCYCLCPEEIRLWKSPHDNHKLILIVSFRVTVSCFQVNRHTEISPCASCSGCAAVAAWGRAGSFCPGPSSPLAGFGDIAIMAALARREESSGGLVITASLKKNPLKLEQIFFKICINYKNTNALKESTKLMQHSCVCEHSYPKNFDAMEAYRGRGVNTSIEICVCVHWVTLCLFVRFEY